MEIKKKRYIVGSIYPENVCFEGENLIPDVTQCKVLGSCGTTDVREKCCAPAVKEEKSKPQMVNLAGAGQTCEPGSGYC
ncbi:hypothetical protein [Pedobacter sp. V48]|uniref:hypothetical protein n=1 Tax=Pedobacter sp. V48 TaxID=509635 RepID=UPI0003E4F436|nr:hypothetical protein [Pedobacter sp. V48]ETZ20206.1 hypothetical protein N824_08310 [Pedobacter sp. V48]